MTHKVLAAVVLTVALAAVGGVVSQHPHQPAAACPDKCSCAETGKCRCLPCPTEMSGGYTKRAVREGRRLVAFVGVKPRPVADSLTYGTAVTERGKPARYVAVFVPDGTGGGARVDLPPGADDAAILATGTPKPLAMPGMPRTR